MATEKKVEMEHTNDPDIAREIAMDHLTEDPDYYKKLEVMETQKDAAHRVATRYLEGQTAAESAKQAYARRFREIQTRWGKIERYLKKHAQDFKKDGETNWGYVGDLGYLLEKFDDVAEGWDV